MATFDLWSQGGSSNPDYPLSVYLYPDDSYCRNKVKNQAAPGAKDLLDQMISDTVTDGYYILIHTADLATNATTNTGFEDDFEDYLQNNGYDSYNGAHIGVSNGFGGGYGSPANPWQNHRQVEIGIKNQSNDWITTASGHEVAHACIDSTLGDVQDLCHNANEHTLGYIWYGGESSLMAAIYDDAAEEGDCWSPYSRSDLGTDITWCTENAIIITENHYL